MSTFSTSIKELSIALEKKDYEKLISSSSEVLLKGSSDDKLKFICDNKEVIIKAIDLAKVFTGPKGDKLLDTLKSVIESLCS